MGKKKPWSLSDREIREMEAEIRERKADLRFRQVSPSSAVIDEMFRLAKGLSGSVCPCDNLPCKNGAEFIRYCDDIIYIVFGGRDIDGGSRCERAVVCVQ